MKSKEIYQAIDLSKVGPELKTKLIALEKATDGFTNERADGNMDMAMNKIYAHLKDKKPESLKNIEVKTIEVEEKVETMVEGQPVKKTTKTKKKVAGKKKKVAKKTATPSSGLKKPTVSSVASKIRKPNESWSDALSRAKVIFNEKKQTQVAKTKKAVDDLRDFLKDDKNFTGWPRTYGKEKASDNSLERDAQRQASPPGKRVSKTGRVYYENRDNRADREANSFPRKIFLKEGGDIMIEPTILQNNPNYLVGTTSMSELFEKGGYVAVSEKDGYWYIMSKPSSKEEAQEVIDMGVPRGEKGKVVTLEEAKAYNKVIGREYLEKGGKISSSTTYVPNRSIKELSIILGKSLKTLKGTDLVDGVYVKNDALKSTKKSSLNSVDGIFDDILSMATLQGLEDDIKVVKKDDIQKLLDAGYDSEDIMVIYFGPSALTNVKIDISYSSGLFGYREDYIPTKIQNFVEAAKNKTYEIGLKYPQFNWSDILKKYKIDKIGIDVNGEKLTSKTSPLLVRGAKDLEYTIYRIFEGDKVVLGTRIDKVRIVNGKRDIDYSYRPDPEEVNNFKGGYWGVVSSDKKIILDIAKMILRKNTGYVKDMQIFVNGLGGVDAETLDLNKIPYELGGEVVIPTTYLDYNPDYLVGTNTMYEMFADGGIMAKGGEVSVYNLRKGDKVKTRKGDIETILKKNSNGNYETLENDYTHNPESLEFISRPSRKMAKGGATTNSMFTPYNYVYYNSTDYNYPYMLVIGNLAWGISDEFGPNFLGNIQREFFKSTQDFANNHGYRVLESRLPENVAEWVKEIRSKEYETLRGKRYKINPNEYPATFAKGGQIKSPYIVTFGFQGDDEYEIAKSKPIFAENEDEAALMLKDQFESFEGIDCDIIRVKKMADGGSIPEGYHQMPDVSIMADSMQMAKGGRLLTTRERYIQELKGLATSLFEGLDEGDKFYNVDFLKIPGVSIEHRFDEPEYRDDIDYSDYPIHIRFLINQFIRDYNLSDDEILNAVIGLGRKQISIEDFLVAIDDRFDGSQKKELLDFIKSDEALRESDGDYLAKGGYVDLQANLMKELQKLQRDLNSPRLSRYTEGDNSQEEMARQRERASKLARFNEILDLLRELESKKMAEGGAISDVEVYRNVDNPSDLVVFKGNTLIFRDEDTGELEFIGNVEREFGLTKREFLKEERELKKIDVSEYPQDLLVMLEEGRFKNNKLINNPFLEKGGEVSVYNLRKGDKVKTRKGDIETILKKNSNGNYETLENDYTHSAESLEFISRPSRKMADGGMMSKGGAMEHMILLGDKVLDIYKNVLIVQSVSGGVTVIDFRQEPIARRILVERITGKNTLASAKEFIDTDPSFNNYVSKEAMEIASLTATRPDAVQKFVDTNNLDIEKLYQFVKKENSKDRFGGFAMDFVTALEGKPSNPIQNKMIRMFQESENQKMAKGGSLQGHGLEVGDLIVEDLGGYIKVMSEDGKEYFIKLRDGDRLTEPPLPFERGGEVKIGDIARLAAKYNKTGQEVTNAISKGADVEVEHTEDRKKAMRIAVDHLEEDFYYYTKLKAVEGEVDLTEFYEGGGNVPKVFDVPPQFLDSEGKRKNDKKTIKELTDFVLGLPQTKSIYYNDNLGGYTPSRKKLHAEIINKFKKEVVCINNDKPIAIFMGGSPASGKSSFLRKYSPFLLKEEILKIDADEIRAMLPEYEGWNATQTHLETKDIVNTLLSNKNIGIPCDFDIIYDGTMNSVKSYIPLMDILRKRGYKIFIVFMDNVPKDVIIKRALDRYKKSGRFVPLEVIEDFFSKGKSAFNELKKDVDGYMRIDGSSQDYKVLEEGGMKLPRDREYSKLGTKIKASDIPISYKKGGLSKLY